MKFTVLQKNLEKALNVVVKAVNQRSPLQILSNVYIKAEAGRIYLSASDLHMSISAWVAGKVDKDGEITILARLISEFINQIREEKVDFDLNQALLSVSTQNVKATFSTMPTSDFPLMPESVGVKAVTIDSTKFLEALERIQFAAATEDSRPILTGVFMKISGGMLTLAATDGYKMAEVKVTIDSNLQDESSIVVPAKAFLEVVRMFAQSGRPLSILILNDKNTVVVKTDDFEAHLRVLDGSYPDYDAIVPAEFVSEVKISKDEFLSAIRISSIFSKEFGNSIKIICEDKGLVIKSQPTEMGSNVSNVKAEVEGEDFEIAFNAKYLLDFLNASPAEEIIFKISGPLKPCYFNVSGVENYFFLAMPMKANW